MRSKSTDKKAAARSPVFRLSGSGELAASIVERQQQGIVGLDQRGRVVLWNEWMVQWTHIAAARAVDRTLDAIAPGLIGSDFLDAVRSAVEAGQTVVWSLEMDPQRLDLIEAEMTRGDRLLPLSRVCIAPLEVGTGTGCLIEFLEAPFNPTVVRAKNAADTNARVIDDARLPLYFDNTEESAIVANKMGRIVDVNAHLLAVTGYEREQLIGAPLRALFPVLDSAGAGDDCRVALESRIAQNREGVLEAVSAYGEPLPLRATVYDSVIEGHFCLACRDVSRQQGTQNTILRQRELLATLYSQVADGIVLVDGVGLIEQINPVGRAMLDLRVGQGQHEAVELLVRMQDGRGRPVSPCRDALQRGSVCTAPEDAVLVVEGREPLNITGTATPLRDQANRINGCVLVFRTVDESRRVSSRLSWQVDHDPLTQLPNRRNLENELLKAIESAQGRNRTHVLLYIDLHNFSLVNDAGGRAAGDTLLNECAKLLRRVVATKGIVARIGNDEFGVLLLDCEIDEARDTAGRIISEFKSFSFPWQERRLKVGANIGGEVIDRETGSEIDVLVAAAASCSQAKEDGRNRVYFRHVGDRHPAKSKLALWLPRISEALEQDRFCLYYQPIVPLGQASAEISHYEALIRMIDESGQLVAPNEFIPAAENYGLIDEIDSWTTRRVISELAREKPRKRANLRISMNLSGNTIGDENFLGYLMDLIESSGVDPNLLQFEITETAAVRQFDRALELIHTLKSIGCYFSLDDFGSGLSSFGYLKQLPVDYLKIDGAFVRNMEFNDIEFSMVSTINHLAHIMGIATIAECVENQAQMTMLEQIGVDYVQGFFIARPQPLKDLAP